MEWQRHSAGCWGDNRHNDFSQNDKMMKQRDAERGQRDNAEGSLIVGGDPATPTTETHNLGCNDDQLRALGFAVLAAFGSNDYVAAHNHCLRLLGCASHDDLNINTIGLATQGPPPSPPVSNCGSTTTTTSSTKQHLNATKSTTTTTTVGGESEIMMMEEQEQETLPGKALGLMILRYVYNNNPERACGVEVVDVGVDGGKSRALFCAGHFLKGSLLFKEEADRCVIHMQACEPYKFSLAQNALGLCYEKGSGVEKDQVKAFRLYTMAAEQGLLIAQRNLGNCYRFGIGVYVDKNEAVSWYIRSCALPTACASLSNCYKNGEGVIKDPQESLRLLKIAAEHGVAKAQCRLGTETSDPVESLKLLRLAADQGEFIAQTEVGLALLKGIGVKKDTAEAARYFRLAVAQGNHFAMRKLAGMYREGAGVPQDLKESFRLLHQAAELGNCGAQNDVGFCYSQGTGVHVDYSLAAHWYRKAISNPKGPSPQALANLASIYTRGQGVPKDLSEAFKLYSRAALLGNNDSPLNVGRCWELGTGTPTRDAREAMRWYRIADSRGNTNAKKAVKAMMKNLDCTFIVVAEP
ncbi:sel1 repeat family protein [Pelomyxa schiedti]|nr:sel1 repeat family protein [Pelomyxa schiedti]